MLNELYKTRLFDLSVIFQNITYDLVGKLHILDTFNQSRHALIKVLITVEK